MQLLFVKYQTLSVLMLRNCAPVFIFTTGSSTLLGRPRCDLSICCYLPHSIHFSEFMSVVFTRKRTKHKNTRSPPFLYDTKMAADGYYARKALILRERFFNQTLSSLRIQESLPFPVLHFQAGGNVPLGPGFRSLNNELRIMKNFLTYLTFSKL